MMPIFQVRVQPRSSQNKVEIQSDGSLKVWTSAPPVDGAANDAVVKLLAKTLGLSPSQVRIVAGTSGRQKDVEIDVEAAELRSKLGMLPLD